MAQIERLEVRRLLSVSNAIVPAAASAMVFQPTAELFRPHGANQPAGSASPVGFQPAQISHAYGFDQISFNGGITGNGSGQTIAIVDAYDTPNMLAELQAFDAQFGIPDPPSFKRVAQDGSTNYPATDPRGPGTNNWELETALDVEWSHALAPGANILLVEANDNGSSLDNVAVPYAASQPGVSVVSMSFGSNEFTLESGLDTDFTTPSGHTGVTFVASTGDNGSPGEYPAYSPNVLAVGGTSLSLNAQNQVTSETGWSGSGGGISANEPQPSYQSGFVTQSSTQRTIPDISFDANPGTGVTIYDSYNGGTSTPWEQIGGTSVSAPSWSALIAIANQGRSVAGLANLDGRSGTLPDIYNLPSSDFRDITSGSNGGFSAAAGYDLVTGRGSPNAPLVVAGLAGTSVITGSVFSDSNNNGVQDSGEGGLAGWTVYDDLNNDGVFQPPAQHSISSPNAPKTIPARSTITSTTTVSGLVGGIIDLNVNLSITISRDSNLLVTLTGPDGTLVTLSNRVGSGANFTNTTFDDQAATAIASGTAPFTGSFKPSSVLSAFNGKTPNGVWTLTVNGANSSTSGTLSSWSLQILNPTEPSVTTSADGTFALPATAGTHHLRVIGQTSFTATAPAGGVDNVAITAGQNSSANNFGFLPSSISGVIFDDTNNNGVLDSGENVTQGLVFDDLNNSGAYDNNASQYTVNSLDVSKSFSGASTTLSSAIVDDLSGKISDLNVNLSINDTTDSNLSVTLIGPDGTAVNLINHNGGTGDNFANTTLDDQATTAIGSGSAPFSASYKPASVLSAFNGKSPNGTWRLMVVDTAASDSGSLVNWSLHFTTNAPEPIVISYTGAYTFTNLIPGAHHIREYVLTDALETSPASDVYDVNVSNQTTVTGANFGNHAASISGKVFLDSNQNGTLDNGESGLAGWLVYDDVNNNGIYDQPTTANYVAQDDPQSITGQSTTTSYITVSGQNDPIDNVFVNLSLHYPNDGDLLITLTDPAGTTINLDNQAATGQNMLNTTFQDGGTQLINGNAPYSGTFQSSDFLSTLGGDTANGVWKLQVTDEGQGNTGTLDGWNMQLTAGTTEPSVATGSDGSFQFNDLTAGTHYIREVPPPGYAETSPTGGVYAVTVSTGSYVTGQNFGNILVSSPTPAAPVLLPASDTGSSNSDDITRLNNVNAASELGFQVAGTVSGALVTLEADGIPIGSATATGATTTITTDGISVLADGNHLITAVQTVSGGQPSAASPSLTVDIDSTPPVATITPLSPNPLLSGPNSLTIVFNEPVTGLDLTDLSLTLNSGPNLLTGAQTISTMDGLTWTLSNLAPLTAATGTYQLTANPVGTPIVDVAGNPDATTASTSFTVDQSPPVVDLNGAAAGVNYNVTWANAGPVSIADPLNATIVDAYSGSLNSLTVAIANPQPGDTLSANTAGTNIAAIYSPGVLSLTGSDTVANYQQVLRSIQYDNTAGGPGTNTVVIGITASDGVLTSSEADAQVTINLGPPAAAIAGPATTELNQSQTFTLTATDPSPAQQSLGFTFAINWGDGSPVQQISGLSGTQVAHAFTSAGNDTVTVTATDQLGNTSAPATLGVAVTMPQVSAVLVDGTSWSAAYTSALQLAGQGNGAGYAIPVGTSQQLQTLPWTNLNQIQVVFSEGVNVQQSDLTVTGVNTPQYAINGFSYSAATNTATWTLSTNIGADRLTLNLDGHSVGGVHDQAGNLLDGDWTNGTSVYPSGNGTPGGDFNFGFNVLPADANHDGIVNGQDIAQVASHWLQTGIQAGDTNGDAVVNGQDIAAIASHWLATLPAGGGGSGAELSAAVAAIGTPTPSTSAAIAASPSSAQLVSAAAPRIATGGVKVASDPANFAAVIDRLMSQHGGNGLAEPAVGSAADAVRPANALAAATRRLVVANEDSSTAGSHSAVLDDHVLLAVAAGWQRAKNN